MINLTALLFALSLVVKRVYGSGPCEVDFFATLIPSNATIEKVAHVPNNGTYGEGTLDLNYPTQPTGLPELCAVTVLVVSSAESFYRFGLFLPTVWNDRFLAVGNGGFGGGINWLDMGAGVGYDFAVVSTDTGHNSTSTDASWALNNTEKKIDWGWRAVHGSVVLAKHLVESYYETRIAYSYFNGCSTGGRQGLKEVQISPDSFDGVIVGASAWDSSHLNPWVTKVGTYNLPVTAPNNIGADLFPTMATEVLNQCDSLDGVSDGIISAPSQCKPDYTTLLCGKVGTNSSTCLTLAQIESANKVYADYCAPTGELLYPGLNPGCENQWFLVLNYTDTSPYGINFIRDILYDDESWCWTSYNDSVIADASRINPGNATADDYNLADYSSLGKKMIIYHGLADGLVPPKGSELYYTRVAETLTQGNITELQKFFRYFEVPGMGHCWASSSVAPAPWAFGGGSQASQLGTDVWSVPGFKDAQHDILLAMMQWVENGTAVDSIVATTWENSLDPSTPVARQRPLCPYPQVAVYDGVGDVDMASSWSCQAAGEQ